MEVLRYASTSRSTCIQRLPLGSPRKLNACRRLNFGTTAPTTCAQEANEQFLQQAFDQMAYEYSCKWEFDFQAGQPLPSSSNSRFQYKILEPTKTPALYSPVNVIDEENVSDAENCPQCLKMPVNVALKSLDESQEFVFPTIKSPKKVLKKTGKQIYSTPKKSRNTQLTEFMDYRKRRSVTAAKSSPFKSSRNQHTNRAFASRRHSLAE